MEVAIRTTLCIAGIIKYICNLVTDSQCTCYKNAFNKCFLRIVCRNKSATIYSEKNITVCNAVFFRLCIDLMHILPPVTAEGFDGSHHPRFAECKLLSPDGLHPQISLSLTLIILHLVRLDLLVICTLLFVYFFKELISFIGTLDKWHTSLFNALIFLVGK